MAEPSSTTALTAWPDRMASPVFVVGSMGSGSTLTRLVLDSHENMAIAQETSFMRLVTAHRSVPFWRFGPEWYGRLELTSAELDHELVRFYSGLFERYARRHGKRRWGEKTPHHVWHMAEMARLFPDAVFVAIVRHPGATVGSLVGRFGMKPAGAVRHWLRVNRELVAQGARLGDRFALIRYEDLVLDTEATLRELLDWLGEPWSPRVLQHHAIQRQQGAPKVVEGSTRSRDPVDPDRVGRWMTRLPAAERALLRRRTDGWARFFGYDVNAALPVEPMAAQASARRHLLGGQGLAQRREEFGDRLDLRPPKRPAVEGTFPLSMWPGRHTAPPAPPAPRGAGIAVASALARRLPQPLRLVLVRIRRGLRTALQRG